MSKSKYFNIIAWCIIAATLVITLLFMFGDSLGLESAGKIIGYENRLFDTERIHTIDIVASDWKSFIETCENEEYTEVAVVIDGETYKNVGIRAKGNTSLSSVRSMNSDRYSFKLEFDHYDSTRTYHGLDKLSLNNLIQDNTMMKDYLAYRLMGEFGVASPLCSFVYITVNGEDWGLYLAVEGVEDSFLERNFNNNGELYKPDSMSMGGGRGNGKEFNMDDFMNNLSDNPPKNEKSEPTQKRESRQFGDMAGGFGGMGGGGFGGFGGMGSSDVKLQYINDDPASYSNIFNNAKTDITDEDKSRLIEALKKLSANEQIDEVVDVDEVIRYFIVHNFVVNGDSYTGTIIHNYYLHENNGKMSMIPWDYNLAFGTFQSSNASSSINSPIDSPVSGNVSDRPMIAWIFENEEYLNLYHSLYKEFISSSSIIGIIDSAHELIYEYVERDPSKFCTTEEFEKGVAALKEFCSLRIESVTGQLNGTIPSTSQGQSGSKALVSTGSLNLNDMGSMGKGGGFGDGMKMPEGFTRPDGNGMQIPEGFTRPDGNGMQMPEGFARPDGENMQMPEGFTRPNGENMQMPEGFTRPNGENMQKPTGDRNFRENGNFSPQGIQVSQTKTTNLLPLGICILLLVVGIAVVKLYKR